MSNAALSDGVLAANKAFYERAAAAIDDAQHVALAHRYRPPPWQTR